MSRVLLRLHQIGVPFGSPEEEIRRSAAAKLNLAVTQLPQLKVVRRSLDTRHAPRIYWSFAVEFEGEPELIAGLPANEASVVEQVDQPPLARGGEPLSSRLVVVGAGPAGFFTALTLAENGYAPLVVERGRPVAQRDADVAALLERGQLDPESNFLFGEGGAGAYSDGKLTTRTGGGRLRRILRTLVECGAPDAILLDARPHIGSDLLPAVITRLRKRIESLGGEFRFGFKVARLLTGADGAVNGVVSAAGESVPAGLVILAVGTSARDLFEALGRQGVALEARPFQVGVRVEHLQRVIDEAVYRRERGALPPAEYILSCPPSPQGRGLASFCMCPGGVIVPAVSEPGHLSTNGMSRSARDGAFANAALVVTVEPGDLKSTGPLAGVEFQRDLERRAFAVAGDYRAPSQRAADFLAGKGSIDLPEGSYPLGMAPADLSGVLPDFLAAALKSALPHFERKLPGFIGSGVLVAVEARVSSPLRVLRDKDSFESLSTPRLYPAGEGAGYSGGIMSSAVDGIRVAEAVMARLAPFARTE